MSGARYGAILGVTLVGVVWTCVVAFVLVWGGADRAAALMGLLALGIVGSTAFLRHVHVREARLWGLVFGAAATAFQVVLCAGVVFEIHVDEGDARPSVVLLLGGVPVIVGLAFLALATGRPPLDHQHSRLATGAFIVIAVGTFAFWFVAWMVDEGVREDALLEQVFVRGLLALLTAAPAIAYSLAGAIAASTYEPWG